MPTSHYKQIPTIVEAVLAINPTSILEIGIGCGKYGALLREYLTVWDHYFEPWESRPLRMDGIEIHPLYASSPAWACYDKVIVGDARVAVLQLTDVYDLALLVDVLEHFTPADGAAFLKRLHKRARTMVIGLPAVFAPTLEVWNNKHEIHRSGWSAADLEALGMTVETVREDDCRVMVVR